MAELLLELLSEEIPARMQARAAADLKRLVTERLTGAGLAFKEARAYVTPRRLALVVTGLPKKQPDVVEEKKGPRPDAPDQAIQGFLRGNGLGSIDEAELRETDKGAFYFAVKRKAGLPTDRALVPILEEAIDSVPWPKSMRWGNSDVRWVRPLHNILAIFDGETLAFDYDLIREVETVLSPTQESRLAANDRTWGHRFLAPKEIAVKSFADYKKKLKAAKVLLDRAERRAVIEKQAKQKAGRVKLVVRDDPTLLDEVTGLVEWPVVLMGRIDPEFMDLPPEVLTTAMRHHQKYLALLDQNGDLAPRFLVVANMETADNGKAIAAGNERVLRARLADARFFWDQDRKQSLAQRTPRLGDIVFHAKLGSLDEKIDRVQALAVEIAGYVPGADKDRVRSAARLAKADLVTGMVGEFPELQGVMGRYYALADGEHPEVAEAIAEHYSPQGPNDACPTAPVSVAVALADKIDTLVGFFAIDEKPTGSRDPFALRRAALGVIRLIIENELRLPLTKPIGAAYEHHASTQYSDLEIKVDAADRGEIARDEIGPLPLSMTAEQVGSDLLDFFADRLKVALREKGVRHDLIAAVFALGGEDDLVRLLARVEALETFLKTDDGEHLLVAYGRAANIVRIEEKRDKTCYLGADVSTNKLVQDEEKLLANCIFDAERNAEAALAREDFTGAMAALAKLRKPVDDFFDKVTVNTEDPDLRANRLRLLARIGETLGRVADFSKIEG